MSKIEKLVYLYYKTFVEWGDKRWSVTYDRPWLHNLWMFTIGFPVVLYLHFIWWGPRLPPGKL